MCGIAGILRPGLESVELHRLAFDMARTLLHRGPDHGDVFIDPKAGLALSHRRLAIIDTSPAGQQPMVSACGRFVIAFNGEIYNFRKLKKQLGKSRVCLRSDSDTEVFLEYIAAHGAAQACHAANGMFAFAIWDRRDNKLTLGRDRFGQKPLYYGNVDGSFYFASELKAIDRLRREPSNKIKRHCRSISGTVTYLHHGPSIVISVLEPPHIEISS